MSTAPATTSALATAHQAYEYAQVDVFAERPLDAGTERERGVQVRIFTVREELQFAGHPTLGTASWLYLNHPVFAGAETITLDLQVGPIPVTFPAQQEGLGVSVA